MLFEWNAGENEENRLIASATWDVLSAKNGVSCILFLLNSFSSLRYWVRTAPLLSLLAWRYSILLKYIVIRQKGRRVFLERYLCHCPPTEEHASPDRRTMTWTAFSRNLNAHVEIHYSSFAFNFSELLSSLSAASQQCKQAWLLIVLFRNHRMSILKWGFFALPDGSGSFTGRQR